MLLLIVRALESRREEGYLEPQEIGVWLLPEGAFRV